jgi:hypothetical protein
MKQPLTRRRVLRGMLNGAAVTVGLPLLDCFLNDNGTALANGVPLPLRFGTWSWGCGMNHDIFVPQKLGPGYDLPEEISSLKPVREHINILTNFKCFPDGAPRLCHYTGWVILRSGSTPKSTVDRPGQTIDVTIARKIAAGTRYQSLTVSATSDQRDTLSYVDANSVNMAIASPLSLYEKLFGTGFQDPNAPEFKADPMAMVRKSVLSGVLDDARKMQVGVGAADKARLDQYFTALRDLERQLELQTIKPEPRPACVVPSRASFEQPMGGVSSDSVAARHKLLTDLLVMAVACDQTRVFNMLYSKPFSGTTRDGYDKTHHTATHEEPMDVRLGYQPNVSWFVRRSMENWAAFVEAFSKFKEGNGTLLDNMLIYATTDVSFAKVHSVEDLPAFTAGRAGGRLRTGLHIDGAASAGTRIGYTALRVMGIDVPSWGTQSNSTSKEISEILA